MKVLYLFFVLLSCSLVFPASAQHYLSSRELQTNFGFGGGVNGLPFYVGVEYGINNTLSFGVDHSRIVFARSSAISETAFRFNIRLGRFLQLPDDWDFYTGLKSSFLELESNGSHKHRHRLLLNMGARYYWNRKWAVNFDLTFGPGGTRSVLGFTRKLFIRK